MPPLPPPRPKTLPSRAKAVPSQPTALKNTSDSTTSVAPPNSAATDDDVVALPVATKLKEVLPTFQFDKTERTRYVGKSSNIYWIRTWAPSAVGNLKRLRCRGDTSAGRPPGRSFTPGKVPHPPTRGPPSIET